MHKLSFEKARRLKDAGLPQPEFSFGQRWYDANKNDVVFVQHYRWISVTNKPVSQVLFAESDNDNLMCLGLFETHDFVYIPTEGELFEALNEPDWIILNESDKYCISDTWAGTIDFSIAKGATLIDALANAYLEKNGKAKNNEEIPG